LPHIDYVVGLFAGRISLVVILLSFVFCLQERKLGQRLNIIIVAEGAIDQDGNIITPDYVKDVSLHYNVWFDDVSDAVSEMF